MTKTIFSLLLAVLSVLATRSQTAVSGYNFLDNQRGNPKIMDILRRKEDTLMKQFREKKLPWPAKYLYIRSFKYDSQLEVWVKGERNEPFKLFKTYKVCALAGTLGPKRVQGDYQVPEGFYHINEFNPNSNYHLSLGLNYPNLSDRLLSDSLQPGGDIYIHGSCVTTGCIPITDQQMDELYILAMYARNQGQDFIPVHIFPINFKNTRSEDYLAKYLVTFSENSAFESRMKNAFYYFEKYHQLPVVLVNRKGEYVNDDEALPPKPVPKPEKKAYVKKERTYIDFDEKSIPPSVNSLPVYPDGNDAFKTYLEKLSKDVAQFLPEGRKNAFVTVEYIVDKDGKILNPKIVRGGYDELNDHLLDAFEAMPRWKPAIRQEQFVAIKLKQSFDIQK